MSLVSKLKSGLCEARQSSAKFHRHPPPSVSPVQTLSKIDLRAPTPQIVLPRRLGQSRLLCDLPRGLDRKSRPRKTSRDKSPTATIDLLPTPFSVFAQGLSIHFCHVVTSETSTETTLPSRNLTPRFRGGSSNPHPFYNHCTSIPQ